MGDVKTCPKCISEVPRRASVCRYCGHRFFLFPAMVAVTLLIGTILALAPSKSSNSTPNSSANIKTQAAPVLLAKDDPSLPAEVRRVYELEDQCWGSLNPDKEAACSILPDATRQIENSGWCYGEPGDSGADEIWHECVAMEKAPISAKHLDWIQRCKRALLGDISDPAAAQFPDPSTEADDFSHAQIKYWTGLKKNAELINIEFTDGDGLKLTGHCYFRDNYDGTTRLVLHEAIPD